MRTETRSPCDETIAPSIGGVGSSRSPPTFVFPETSLRKSQAICSGSPSGSETSNRKLTTEREVPPRPVRALHRSRSPLARREASDSPATCRSTGRSSRPRPPCGCRLRGTWHTTCGSSHGAGPSGKRRRPGSSAVLERRAHRPGGKSRPSGCSCPRSAVSKPFSPPASGRAGRTR